MEKLIFIPESHEYFVGDVKLTSVSNFYSSFFKKFETDKVATFKAKSLCKEALGKVIFEEAAFPNLIKLFMGDVARAKKYWMQNRAKPKFITSKEVVTLWDEKRDSAAEHGTEVHDTLEHYILGETYQKPLVYEKSVPKIEHGIRYIKEIMTGKITPELRIFSKEWKLAGTIDLYEELEDGTIILSDWKTNEAIEYKGYNYEKGLAPLDHLDSCNYIKYSLQLSIYKAILENFYGKTVVGLYIIHLTENGYERISALDLQQEVSEMLKVHLGNEEGEVVDDDF